MSSRARKYGLLAVLSLLEWAPWMHTQGRPQKSGATSHLGVDLNVYPGDAALPVLRNSFAFAGYWLNSPPGAKKNTWHGKRNTILAQGFGFLVLFNGPLSRELKAEAHATTRAVSDAAHAAAAAKTEGFP